MREMSFADSLMHLPRTVGIGVGSHVGSREWRLPPVYRECSSGPCPRYRSAPLPPVMTAKSALAACNVSSYSES